jgi:RNA polymerase sigma-70 factor (ECF subfamily)
MREPHPHVLLVQQLFVRHQPQLRAFVLSLLPDFVGVDDVIQDVFLTVTTKAADFREGTNFMAWAVTIARHKVFHAQRRLKRPVISAATLDALAASCPEVVAEDRRLKALADCMQKLAPRAQELIRLRYHHEHSPGEIATRLARSVNSVGVALSKARVALRECIEKQLSQADAMGGSA